jgi:hypothetical protein
VRAGEAGVAAQRLGRVLHPDDREGDQAEQTGDRDEVLQEAEHRPGADERDVEVRRPGDRPLDDRAVRLDVDRQQDEERPHDEEVRDAGRRPFEQLLLPEHLDELRLELSAQIGPGIGDALGSRWAHCREFVEEQHPAARDGHRQNGHHESDDGNPEHGSPPTDDVAASVLTWPHPESYS